MGEELLRFGSVADHTAWLLCDLYPSLSLSSAKQQALG
jgi:hypothetical protein